MKGSEEWLVRYMEGASKHFIIPVYQRNYDWKTEQCKQLYDDLVKVIQQERKSHFFGSIVSVSDPDGKMLDCLIIDGQQRLTTVSLLLLAMYNLMREGVVTPAVPNLSQRIYKNIWWTSGNQRKNASNSNPLRMTVKPLDACFPQQTNMWRTPT